MQEERVDWNRLLQGTYNDHFIQLPEKSRAGQKLEYVIKGIVQMLLKN